MTEILARQDYSIRKCVSCHWIFINIVVTYRSYSSLQYWFIISMSICHRYMPIKSTCIFFYFLCFIIIFFMSFFQPCISLYVVIIPCRVDDRYCIIYNWYFKVWVLKEFVLFLPLSMIMIKVQAIWLPFTIVVYLSIIHVVIIPWKVDARCCII
jgi:hypothetical protein